MGKKLSLRTGLGLLHSHILIIIIASHSLVCCVVYYTVCVYIILNNHAQVQLYQSRWLPV